MVPDESLSKRFIQSACQPQSVCSHIWHAEPGEALCRVLTVQVLVNATAVVLADRQAHEQSSELRCTPSALLQPMLVTR